MLAARVMGMLVWAIGVKALIDEVVPMIAMAVALQMMLYMVIVVVVYLRIVGVDDDDLVFSVLCYEQCC